MPDITAKMVKELRDMTDAGMMDCKKALIETGGDMDAAVEHLRKAGIAKAAKKAGRTATEGRVAACIKDGIGVLVEVLCETDFVARNEVFNEYAQGLAARIADDYSGDRDLGEEVSAAEKDNVGELVGKIGENIQLRRAQRWESDGTLAYYLHMGGKIGVMADIGGDVTDEMANDICMHIAAFNPHYVSPDQVPESIVEKEREIAEAQVTGKPDNIIDKIVDGKIRKWYTEVCLTEQPWLRDDKTTLSKLAPNVEIRRFVRWQVGEELVDLG